MTSSVQSFGRVAVLMGGISAEREVSLRSGKAVLDALRNQGVDARGLDVTPDTLSAQLEAGYDRVFNMLHGRWGEDGVIQGALETMGVPYTGSGVLGCALAMDKVRTKQVWQALNLPTPKFRVLRGPQDLYGLIETLGLPLFLKPAREGSSVGVGKVTAAGDLEDVYHSSAEIGDDVIAESFVDGAEVTVGILNDRALPVVRMAAANEFYDYEAKYESDETKYYCPAGLTAELEAQIQSLALAAFKAVDCKHWGRVDVMLTADESPMLLEVNPIPGMTDHSLVPMAAKQAGLSFEQLVLTILESAK